MERGISIAVRILLLLVFLIVGFFGLAFALDDTYRYILKAGGLVGAFLGILGISVAGYFAGKDYDSYTGWERFTHGAGMFFKRKPFQKGKPTYEVTEKTIRVNWVDSILNRNLMMMPLMMPPDGSAPKWLPDKGPDALPEPIRTFFLENGEIFKLTLEIFGLAQKQHAEWHNTQTATRSLLPGPMHWGVLLKPGTENRNLIAYIRPNRRDSPRFGTSVAFTGIKPFPLRARLTRPNCSRRSPTPSAPLWLGSPNSTRIGVTRDPCAGWAGEL